MWVAAASGKGHKRHDIGCADAWMLALVIVEIDQRSRGLNRSEGGFLRGLRGSDERQDGPVVIEIG